MDLARGIKPQQLRFIEKIAATGKLQLAAEEMNISQPAASRTLGQIEDMLGTQLFERSPKGMIPTPVGHALLRHSETILAAYSNLEVEVQGIGDGQMGEVRVGAVNGPAVRCLIPAILKLKETSPQIEPTLEAAPSGELVRLLDQGFFDFVLARIPSHYDSRAFQMLPARSENIVLIVRDGHPLADRKDVSLADLTDYSWTIQERGNPIRTALEGAFAEDQLTVPSNITNTSSLLITLGLVENSDTIAATTEEVAEVLGTGKTPRRLRTLNLNKNISVAPYYVIMKRGRRLSRVAERLLEEVLKRF